MDMPLINFLKPSNLEGFKVGSSLEDLPPLVPKTFFDAMQVREHVFVKEQGISPDNEFDQDDSRSCHWVLYARSSAGATPVGTIRLVPFPHDPHPQSGGRYWNGVLEGDVSGGEGPAFAHDRPTTFHDGREPYVKLGRLAVAKDFRGIHLAPRLVETALAWLKKNPSYFASGSAASGELSQWDGLVCVHAQASVVGAWKKWGFVVDEAMGTWWEEGIPHVGMFQRLSL